MRHVVVNVTKNKDMLNNSLYKCLEYYIYESGNEPIVVCNITELPLRSSVNYTL